MSTKNYSSQKSYWYRKMRSCTYAYDRPRPMNIIEKEQAFITFSVFEIVFLFFTVCVCERVQYALKNCDDTSERYATAIELTRQLTVYTC